MGTTSLGILYLSFTFFSLVASPVVRALGSKNALILGTTGYWLFIAANLKPTWYLIYLLFHFLSDSIVYISSHTFCISQCLRFKCLEVFLCRYTMVPASLYMGFAASIIWVGQVQ